MCSLRATGETARTGWGLENGALTLHGLNWEKSGEESGFGKSHDKLQPAFTESPLRVIELNPYVHHLI